MSRKQPFLPIYGQELSSRWASLLWRQNRIIRGLKRILRCKLLSVSRTREFPVKRLILLYFSGESRIIKPIPTPSCSYLLSTFRTIFYSPYLILGLMPETNDIEISLYGGANKPFKSEVSEHSIELLVESCDLQILDATLVVTPTIGLFQSALARFPLISLFVTASIFNVLGNCIKILAFHMQGKWTISFLLELIIYYSFGWHLTIRLGVRPALFDSFFSGDKELKLKRPKFERRGYFIFASRVGLVVGMFWIARFLNTYSSLIWRKDYSLIENNFSI